MENNNVNDLRDNVGTIMFDSNDNVISYSGIGKERISDIKEFSVLTIQEGGTLVVNILKSDLKAYLYKNDEIILVVYIPTKHVVSSSSLNKI